MTKLINSLKTRLALSHVLVVVVGAITMLVAGNQLAPALVGDHFRMMEDLAGSMMGHGEVLGLEQGILDGFDQALLIAAVVSSVVAILAATFASSRLLRPLETIRAATHRLAAGDYGERIAPPRESELAVLAEDVNALASALEDTEVRRMRLISEVAHELRTPLATMKGYMEGLVDGVFPPTTEIFAATAREAERLERLASDLGELSRSEEARFGLKPETVDLANIILDVARRLGPQFEDGGVELVVEPTLGLVLEADPDRMAQVFTNIIGNALTYTPAGGRVSISSRVRASQVWVDVADTGRGLSSDQEGAVFERFYRADRSVPGGTGIGLTIARNIVRQHGGDIIVTSPGLGKGTTFTVRLPAV